MHDYFNIFIAIIIFAAYNKFYKFIKKFCFIFYKYNQRVYKEKLKRRRLFLINFY